ncbi:Cutinase transcription factor 1 alpha [Metarhizium brunneum]|uniref:Cutinase transcription factor 1 alpha n=1 Tax=Metarhizium brunneum TaxID=500148 RepID=A0A7D5ZB62_9HYPO
MFAAAGNFVDEKLLTGELGFTKAELKAEASERAMALYDLEYEKETMTIIQSTYLMSYHLGGINADRGPWYWIGIAINLAYGAGLHRLSPCELQTCPTCHSRQWAQLWWSIYCREAWLSLAYNRPMRIQLDEVSTTVPTQVEVASICIDIFDERYHKYLPREIDDLVSMWLYLVRISLTLGDILSKLYASESSRPTQQPINYTEDDVGAHLCELSDESLGSELIKVHLYQLRLYRETTVIALYHPHVQGLQDYQSEEHQS